MVLIYTTCKNLEEAKAISRELIGQRLAVTVNMWTIEAAYLSSEGCKETQGAALLIQTLEPRVQAIEDIILKARRPAVPFIGVVNVFRVNHQFKEKMSQLMK